MPRLAANLTTMFGEAPFLDRFALAARAGFRAVEFQFPYEFEIADIRDRLADNGLRLVLFNMPPGDWRTGERGIAALPGRESEFRDGLARALDYALDLGCQRLHALAGLTPDGDAQRLRDTYLANLRYAAQFAGVSEIEVLIEPISRESIPGYFLDDLAMAADIVDEAGEANLFIQYDLVHQRFRGEDLVSPYLDHAQMIRHVQVAGWPDRHEPDAGAPEWRAAFEALDEAGYDGFVGCEYWPAGGTEAGLGWAAQWLEGQE